MPVFQHAVMPGRDHYTTCRWSTIGLVPRRLRGSTILRPAVDELFIHCHWNWEPIMPQTSELIRVEEFSKTYGEVEAVRDLTFHVGPGEILGLVGPNGAGKTTTLRALAGITSPTAGKLFIAGHDVISDPLLTKQALGYVPDEPHLFDTLTVWEHLEFTAAAYRVDNFPAAAEALLRTFELQGKRDSLAHDLSRGMRQKLVFACTFLHEPRAILFDEPLTGLDPAAIWAVKEAIRERAERGAAIVISSHLLTLVETLCTHLLILHRGRCQRLGPMSKVLQAFDETKSDMALEDVFFAITHDADVHTG